MWIRTVLMLVAMLLLSACATGPRNNGAGIDEFRQQMAAEERVTEINEQLMMMAVSGGDGLYRLGPEDRVRIEILGVSELSREYRINGAGQILLPLVGAVPVAGLTLGELERAVADALGESYLRNPQVSAEVTDFRSQQFTVVGAVQNPRVYTTTRQTTLIEALAMAGGVSGDAGSHVYLTDRIIDPQSGVPGTRTLIIDIEDLMREAQQFNLVLGSEAMINVPRGGFFWVEGAVNRPGQYRQRTDTTVLKALAEAGGLAFEANRSSVSVLRRDPAKGGWTQLDIDYRAIRDDPNQDIRLNSGDVVVVDSSIVRAGWMGFARVITPLALLGFRPL